MALLLALAAAAAVAGRIETIDARLIALEKARIVAEAPLVTLLGRAERLAAGSPTPARGDHLVRIAALTRALAPGIGDTVSRLAAERHALADDRARLVLTALRRQAGGPRANGIPLPSPACPSSAWRLPPDIVGVAPALAERLGQARALTLLALPAAVVPAPAAARVAFAGQFRRYRGTVILDHGHGWTTLVTGLDRLAVRTDAHVAQGEPLGRSAAALPLLGIDLSHHGRPVPGAALLARCMG